MKTCSNERCPHKGPQPLENFRGKNRAIHKTCNTCRENKARWKRQTQTMDAGLTPEQQAEIDRRFVGMIIRRDGNRPAFLAEMNFVNNG